jgi:hypothetical protein
MMPLPTHLQGLVVPQEGCSYGRESRELIVCETM